MEQPIKQNQISVINHRKEMPLRLPILTITLILLCFLYSTSDWIDFRNPNEFSRFYLTRSLIDRQTFMVDEYIFTRDTQDKSYYRGHYYTDKAPGSSFLAAPAYLAVRLLETTTGFSPGEKTVLYIVRSVCVSIPSALFLFLLFSFWGRITPGYPLRRALLIAYGLGTPVWAYSTLFFGHHLAAICLFIAFTLIFKSKNSPDKNRLFLQAGFFSGLAFFIEYPTLLISILLLLYAISLREQSGRGEGPGVRNKIAGIMFFLIGLAIPLSATGYYHWKCFGSVISFPYYYVTDPVCALEHSQGLSGITFPLSPGEFFRQLSALIQLLFSPFRGLFFYSPFLLFGVAGIVKMIRDPKWSREGWLFGSMAVVYFLFFSAFVNWEGGWSMGPRHLVPLLPFLVTAAVYLMGSGTGKTMIWVLAVSVIISLSFTFVGTVVFPHLPTIFKNPLYQFSWRFLRQGIFGPTAGRWIGLKGLPAAMPLLLITGILLTVLLRDLSRLCSPRRLVRVYFSFCCLIIAGGLICLYLFLSSWISTRLTSEDPARPAARIAQVGNYLEKNIN
ncbi:MAG: hypothetical protein U9N73_01665 [Candidatus Auribacterota bacterium]|nr:hypothetical protein [Candidatus Auribacterota bacterium]